MASPIDITTGWVGVQSDRAGRRSREIELRYPGRLRALIPSSASQNRLWSGGVGRGSPIASPTTTDVRATATVADHKGQRTPYRGSHRGG